MNPGRKIHRRFIGLATLGATQLTLRKEADRVEPLEETQATTPTATTSEEEVDRLRLRYGF